MGEVGVDQPLLTVNRIGKVAVAGAQLIEIGEVGQREAIEDQLTLFPLRTSLVRGKLFLPFTISMSSASLL